MFISEIQNLGAKSAAEVSSIVRGERIILLRNLFHLLLFIYT